MNKTQAQTDLSQIEIQLLDLFQGMQRLEVGKLPNLDGDVTMAQMQLICFVEKNPGCHLQDIADGLGLSSPTVSVSIRRLEELGLIAREPDPEDGRASCLTLTSKSQQAHQELRQKIVERARNLLSNLSTAEQIRLIALIEKAVGGIELKAAETK